MVREFSSEQAPALVVQNAAGLIVVRSHDAPAIRVEIEPLTPDAAPLVEAATVEFSAEGTAPTLRVVVPERAYRWRPHAAAVRVVVDVPGGGPVEARTVSADIDLQGAFGSLEAHSTSGDIRIGRVRSAHIQTVSGRVTAAVVDGPCRIATVSGDANLGRVGEAVTFETVSGTVAVSVVPGGVRGRTVSGDVRIGDSQGPVQVSTVSGDVLVGRAADRLAVTTQSGRIAVDRAAAGRLECRSTSGDITIRIEAGRRVAVDAHTLSGRVRSAFPVSDVPVGDPAAPLVDCRLRTVSGDIELGPIATTEVLEEAAPR